MGCFDSFNLKAKCPHCGNEEVFEFQTKALMNLLIRWKEGDKFDKFKRKVRRYAWCPDIIEGILYDCISSCNSKKCRAWELKDAGYNSGFGRTFFGDVVIEKGIVKGVKNVSKKEG